MLTSLHIIFIASILLPGLSANISCNFDNICSFLGLTVLFTCFRFEGGSNWLVDGSSLQRLLFFTGVLVSGVPAWDERSNKNKIK
jgi:hypothetical protein